MLRPLSNATVWIFLGVIACQGAATSAAELQITLKDKAIVHSAQVMLSDIADVTCRDPASLLKARMTEIRVLDPAGSNAQIPAQAVRNRLVLEGWCLEDFTITGAKQAEVTFLERELLTDSDVEAEALKLIVQMTGAEEKDLTVQLQNGFMQSLPRGIRERDCLRVVIVPPKTDVGSVMMSVQVWSGKDLLITRAAAFDVRKRQSVAIARVSLSREMPLDESVVQFEKRFMTSEVDALSPDQLAGQRLRTNVAAGAVLHSRDLQAAPTKAATAVKRGDLVRVVVLAGRLRTSLHNAEALQDGRLGETIKLKNLDSQREIVGKVIGPGIVRIEIK